MTLAPSDGVQFWLIVINNSTVKKNNSVCFPNFVKQWKNYIQIDKESLAFVVATSIYRILLVIYDCLLKGRDLPQSAEFILYARVKDQLNIDKDCILKADRVLN